MKIRLLLYTILCAFLLATVACTSNRASEDSARQTSDSTVQQPQGGMDARTSQPDVDDLELGKSIDANKRVVDGTDDFAPADTIYVSVNTDGAAQDSKVSVRWTYGEDGQLVKEDSRTIPAGGDAWTEFHISKPGGFPKGNYTVTAFVNGEEKGRKTFEVK